MQHDGVSFTLAYAPAKRDAVDATKTLLSKLPVDAGDAKLKHAVDFAGKALQIEQKLAEQAISAARTAAGGAEAAAGSLGTRLGQAAHALLVAWGRAERIAYLRASNPSHAVLAAEASARVPEVAKAWADLQSVVAGANHAALSARVEKLQKYMKFAPKPDATTSTSFTDGAYAEMVDFIKTLDVQLAAFAKDLASSPTTDATVQRTTAAGASHVKMHGTVAEITIDADAFVARAAELFASPVGVVHLTNAKGKLAAVAAVPQLARVATLDLTKNGLTDVDLEQLLASPHLQGLRVLNLTQNQITDAGVEAIARATASTLPALEQLGIQLNKATDPADQLELVDETNRAPTAQEAGKALEAKYGRLAWLHPHD